MRSTSELRKARSRTPEPSISIGCSHGCGSRGSSRTKVAIQPSRSSPRCISKLRTVPSKTKDIRRDTPRRPVANHRAPPNEPEPGDLESVITDQVQRRSHDGAASRLRMQAKPTSATPSPSRSRLMPPQKPRAVSQRDGPAESSTTGPTGRTQRKKLLGISQLVAIRWCRHRRPADHLRIAALLDHRGEIAPVRRPQRDVGLGIDEYRDRLGKARAVDSAE